MLNFIAIDKILMNALAEDIGNGDITTNSAIPPDKVIRGKYIAKENGIICGIDIVKRVFTLLDPDVTVRVSCGDGVYAEKGTTIAEISGNARSILIGERVSLNFLQHLSGISTYTKACVDKIAGTKAIIVDTRKTMPGLRVLEKYAVKTGGGRNHRHNLSDGILIKDNHILSAGGIRAAVDAVRNNAPHTLKIEVEVENMAMVREVLDCHVDIIMLDNMSIEEMKNAVDFIGGRALVEASGNMGEKDLLDVARTGVDIISIGALTHSTRALDISLRFQQ
ncbi:MAG: carboxylating nicotinate-nucleotide diphosphorylase [Eubacteriales bacterium]|nr:carboxylating nicotinate-nucleotide diphosphorylase [Eubacteriales bacterium]